jgi:serine/threonine protein kinase
MGEMYRARDRQLHRDTALKILPEPFARDVERLTHFEREARALAALNHPHIARLWGRGIERRPRAGDATGPRRVPGVRDMERPDYALVLLASLIRCGCTCSPLYHRRQTIRTRSETGHTSDYRLGVRLLRAPQIE